MRNRPQTFMDLALAEHRKRRKAAEAMQSASKKIDHFNHAADPLRSVLRKATRQRPGLIW